MVKATIMGEIHISLNDTEEFKKIVESGNYDAIFIEGREEKVSDESAKSGFFYFFYYLGNKMFNVLSRVQTSQKPIKISAEKLGIPLFYKIDATIPTIFCMSNIWLRRVLIPLLFLFAVLGMFYCPLGFYTLILLVFFLLSPLMYFTFLVHSAKPKRDSFMANSIAEKIETNHYTNVLVKCGNVHSNGIAKNLKLAGIEVEVWKRGIRQERVVS